MEQKKMNELNETTLEQVASGSGDLAKNLYLMIENNYYIYSYNKRTYKEFENAMMQKINKHD